VSEEQGEAAQTSVGYSFHGFFFSSSARALEGMGRDESARMHWYDVMEDAREAGTEWETLG
jgi:hypothetical protein